MLLRSFRVKVVLLATLLSGAVLAGLAVLSLHAISRIGLERLDRELQALGDAHLHKPQPVRHWESVSESLAAIYGDDRLALHVLKVCDRQGRPVYASPHWPVGLKAVAVGVTERVPAGEPDQGPDDVPSAALSPPPPPEEREPPPPWWELWRQSPPVQRDAASGWRPPGPPDMRLVPPRFLTVSAAGHVWRFAVTGNEDVTLIIGADLAGFHAEINQFRNAFLVAAFVALLLLAGGGWVLAGQALRPVRVITRVAEGIGARELDRRIPVMAADREFERLIAVINAMLGRIERSFRQATRFSADAAHELKTPLTVLQGQLEQAVQGAPAASREQRTYVDLLEEVQRLKSIVRKLLLLAQADAGQLRLSRARLDFTGLAQAVADDLPNLAAGLNVAADIEPGVVVLGDAELLNQALQNLAANAVKFNDAHGSVRLVLRTVGRQAACTMANTGPGIPRQEQERLFERFYRADKSRNRRVDGTGLGLSLAREIARAHGGDLVLERSDATLTVFVLTVPLAGPAS